MRLRRDEHARGSSGHCSLSSLGNANAFASSSSLAKAIIPVPVPLAVPVPAAVSTTNTLAPSPSEHGLSHFTGHLGHSIGSERQHHGSLVENDEGRKWPPQTIVQNKFAISGNMTVNVCIAHPACRREC